MKKTFARWKPWLLIAGLGAAALATSLDAAETSPDAAVTLVVFNSADEDSGLLAKFYAEKRGIPPEQVVGLACSKDEQITRRDFDDTIAKPLRTIFSQHDWWKLRPPNEDGLGGGVEYCRIRFVALMRGIPLKIAGTDNYPGDKRNPANPLGSHNEAAVDSELATLSLQSATISGAVNNPYFKAMTAIADAKLPQLLLVCRLDGPSAAVVRRMIVDSLAAEATGLRGFEYLDARSITDTGLKEGDQWLYAAAEDARRNGLPVILDNGPAMFPENYPMRYAAVYAGWYAENVAGPMARPGFRFLPGAVAVHIHSFSAASLRDPRAHWAAPLLNAGAAATLGNVYEPYLAFTPHLDIFLQRLRMGFTFAESAYMSQRALSWMTTFIGDPLYRPFPLLPEKSDAREVAEWEAYRKGALLWQRDPVAGLKALQDSAAKMRSGIIWESLGLLLMGGAKHEPSIESFAHARQAYTNPEDIIRVTIHEVIQLRAAGREGDATQVARKIGTAHSGQPAIGILKQIIPAAFGG